MVHFITSSLSPFHHFSSFLSLSPIFFLIHSTIQPCLPILCISTYYKRILITSHLKCKNSITYSKSESSPITVEILFLENFSPMQIALSCLISSLPLLPPYVCVSMVHCLSELRLVWLKIYYLYHIENTSSYCMYPLGNMFAWTYWYILQT